MNELNVSEVSGTVEQIVFRNEDNGYTVIDISINNSDEPLTAVGNIPGINVGEEVRLVGKYKTHRSFGKQFCIDICYKTLPSTKETIFKYLSCGAIKGIGKSTAEKLIEKFGDDTLFVMENRPEDVCTIKGITLTKAREISEKIKDMTGIKKVMDYLGEFSFLPEEITRIWRVLGNNAIELIKQNPYVICDEDIDISFQKADMVAMSLDSGADNKFRIRAGILFVLNHNANNGHTCLPKDKLSEVSSQFLEIEQNAVNQQLFELITNESVVSCFIDGREFIFTAGLYNSETYVAERLKMMVDFPSQSIVGIEEEIKKIEDENHIEYASLQKEAIREALLRGMIILTGGPGTGKTTTLNGIIKILEEKGEKVFLAAPTGRAAQRMAEVTSRDAKTIHRMLEVSWDSSDRAIFNRNERNPLKCDALILDELSMVDVQLIEAVIRALPLGCRLVMVGDPDQLPSVGSGNVLKDLIDSRVIPSIALKEIFRQSMKSLIVMNAHKIVNGEFPELYNKNSDFFFIRQEQSEGIKKTILDLYNRRLPNAYGYSKLRDIQVLCQGRKGDLGTISLNKNLREVINPASADKKEISINGTIFRENDKVMQSKNNYDINWNKDTGTCGTGIFNGDVGVIVSIDKKLSQVYVRYDDKTARYNFEELLSLEPAYAITIHKSQGSEFEAVIMPMFYGTDKLYYRNLLYTGVTRAKSIMIMVGKEKIVHKMVENNRKTKRYTGLKNFLIG